MAQLISGVQSERIRENLADVRDRITQAAHKAGRDPNAIEVLAASKYIAAADMSKLAEAGVTLVGENRAQDLIAKVEQLGELFTWHFIGQLQSRKVRMIIPHVRLIHSVASESVLLEMARHQALAPPDLGILIEVNIAGEEGKAGIAPGQLDSFIERSPLPVLGLMGMVPRSSEPEHSRRWFAALRDLASTRGLAQLSMGTTQDYPVAVEEGATIVRIGSRLYA